MSADRARNRRLRPAVAGVAAATFGAGAGELAAAIIAPTASPFTSIGGLLIDLAPPWAKDAAIALFGTGDKVALLVGVAVVLVAVGALAGILEARRRRWGRGLFALLGVFGSVAAATRANASLLAILPAAIGALAAMAALSMLLARVPAEADRASVADVDRRRFLAWAGGTAAVGVLAAIASTALSAGSRAVMTVREALRLPEPATTASVPASAELGIDGLAPVITPNREFYRIDTALSVPQVDPADWRLRIHGMLDREVELTWDDLLALPMGESVTTLACVSNEVGGSLIGTAVWLGYPIRELLARAAPTADADMVLSRSIDGFTASTPLEALTDPGREAVLAVGMNGDPLPVEHGFPVRMVVPGLYGYVSATKWVTELLVTRFDRDRAYWSDRGWSERGPIKLSSRIDVPRAGASVEAGTVVVAGVAWQQHTGVEAVEVQVDDGAWEPATLATAISADTWVQWRFDWDAAPGRHTVRVRAISADGEVQTADRAPVAPDGATGLHERSFDVR
ncbi:molybdopterin-dependent oxidoreductase [Agromyces marinus]|uniref:Oxidoreductase n=1 Tax=Agromyces marinus TaxID=1389020 RepID=A0ABN6YDW4_9MICO|nr:molybdopterin-dependent oxidoreductase [Agromyces marinus]UIP59650.1 Protein-methionine-sulfoxide reductase catalytic subunit MsrP [Agromyces marinus]BDZ55281.1 putative oxidoreductase [Agromyces marinus]